MKIGIICHPLYYNYGGILQAWALEQVLVQRGHEVVHYEVKQPIYRPSLVLIVKRLGYKILRNWECSIFSERHNNKIWNRKIKFPQSFVKTHINRVLVNHLTEIDLSLLDVFIVGSDQVWRPEYNRGYCYDYDIANAFLSFTEGVTNLKRIAYAASFGVDNWEFTDDEESRCKTAIQQFDAISVREKSGVELCATHFGVSAEHVLDPTMLLNADNYRVIAQKYSNNECLMPKGDLFCYILDEAQGKSDLIDKLKSTNSFTPFSVGVSSADMVNPKVGKQQQPVEYWLKGFDQSSLVVTDSFHAVVFSILFRKPFVVFANKERGIARLASLLSLFGLENRLITRAEDFSEEMLRPLPNSVYERLDLLREKSNKFLDSALAK
jgi:hypothetical protein